MSKKVSRVKKVSHIAYISRGTSLNRVFCWSGGWSDETLGINASLFRGPGRRSEYNVTEWPPHKVRVTVEVIP